MWHLNIFSHFDHFFITHFKRTNEIQHRELSRLSLYPTIHDAIHLSFSFKCTAYMFCCGSDLNRYIFHSMSRTFRRIT